MKMFVVAGCLMTTAHLLAELPVYEFIELNFLVDSENYNASGIWSINNNGDILTNKKASFEDNISYSIYDRNFNLVELIPTPNLSNPYVGFFRPYFNDNREIVSGGYTLVDGARVAYNIFSFKSDGTVVDYGIYGNHDFGRFRVNNLGQVAVSPASPGEIGDNGMPVAEEAALFTPGHGWQPITTPASSNVRDCDLNAMNDEGAVVGRSGNRPFIWDKDNGGRYIGINSGEAMCINKAGVVAGVDFVNGTFLYDSKTNDLNYLHLNNGRIGEDFREINFTPVFINSSNVVVGMLLGGVVIYSENFGLIAVEDYISPGPQYGPDGKFLDSGWRIAEVRGFNDAGEILVQGRNDKLGLSGVFLLRPIPEPSTYALMALGLAALAYHRRRT